jgi:hypothetical protein
VGIFSFDKPSLLIRDPELVKNILVKDFHNFMDRIISVEEKFDPIFGNSLPLLKGQLWRHLRTHLTPVFTSRKMKMMFYLVDICGKELADCLDKATADGKLPPSSSTNLKETLHVFQGHKIYRNYGKFSLLFYCIGRNFTMPFYWKTLANPVTHVPDVYCPSRPKYSVLEFARYRRGSPIPKFNYLFFYVSS